MNLSEYNLEIERKILVFEKQIYLREIKTMREFFPTDVSSSFCDENFNTNIFSEDGYFLDDINNNYDY